jgi:hypothetical protein
MGYIFISYSRKDTEYAHVLAEHMQSMGFPVWIDARIDYGSQWPGEIQKHLDSCDAFILIMSPRSFASEWVQSELQRAKRKGKPIFPLLLEGDEPWLSVESTQYYDVRSRNVPAEEFYVDLKQALSGGGIAGTPSQLQGPAVGAEPVKDIPRGRRKNVGLFAGIAGIAAICICLLAGVLLIQRVTDRVFSPSNPTGTDIVTAGSNTTSPPALPSTAISPIPTVATAMVLPVQLPDGSEVIMHDGGAEYHYAVLSAQRERLPQEKYLLRLRIRAWTSAIGGMNFWSASFRLVAGDLSLAPVNDLNLVPAQNETMDGDIEFEIDASLQEAILRITVARNPDPWATRELRLVFP